MADFKHREIKRTRSVGAAAIHDSSPSMQMRVRLARKALGLTQAGMAARLGIATQSVSDLERGKNGISVRLLQRLVAMGVSAYWMLEGSGEVMRGECTCNARPARQGVTEATNG